MEYITYAIKQLVYHVETNGILTIKTKRKSSPGALKVVPESVKVVK